MLVKYQRLLDNTYICLERFQMNYACDIYLSPAKIEIHIINEPFSTWQVTNNYNWLNISLELLRSGSNCLIPSLEKVVVHTFNISL